MPTLQVVVRVLDGPSEVEQHLRRPVRITPAGFAGVVYAGAVYPLFVGNIVDIAGPSWEIADCNRFLLSGATVPYAAKADDGRPKSGFTGFRGEWSIDSTQFGHYVLFNAPERTAVALVDALELGGLSVQRWDVSHRLAADGKFYDWFARLRFKGSHEECAARVAFALQPTAPEIRVEVPAPPTRLEDLEAQVEQLLDQVVELQNRFAASEQKLVRLGTDLATSLARETKLAANLDRTLEHQKSLTDQLSELSRMSAQPPDAQTVLAGQAETEELLEYALVENADLSRNLRSVLDRAERADLRILTLEATQLGLQDRLEEVEELDRERRRARESRLAPRRGVPGFLDTAFVRLEFVLDSVEVLANVDTPAPIMRCLMRIDMGELIGKDLEGIRGWREVSKLATGIVGSESMGRIYYKPDGTRVLVSLHIKQDDKEQRRHLERLRAI